MGSSRKTATASSSPKSPPASALRKGTKKSITAESSEQQTEGQLAAGRSTTANKRKRSPTPASTTSTGRKKGLRESKTGKNEVESGPTSISNNKRKKNARSTAPSPPAAVSTAPTHILVLDQGGDSIRFGWSTDRQPRSMPNVTARLPQQWTVLAGDQLMHIQNPHQLLHVTRSTERGMITNFTNQIQVWKRLLDVVGITVPLHTGTAQALGWKTTRPSTVSTSDTAGVTTTKIASHSCAVFLALPPFTPRFLLDHIITIWLDDFGFGRVGLGVSAVCAALPDPILQTCCVVDMGWSGITIVPTYEGQPLRQRREIENDSVDGKIESTPTRTTTTTRTTTATATTAAASRYAIRRLPIGGRHLINIWKYYATYRQWNLMDQTWLLRQVFDQTAFVSMQFDHDLRLARSLSAGKRPFDRHVVLPDFHSTFQCHIQLPPYLLHLQQQQQQEEGEDKQQHHQEYQEYGAETSARIAVQAVDESNIDSSDNSDEADVLEKSQDEDNVVDGGEEATVIPDADQSRMEGKDSSKSKNSRKLWRSKKTQKKRKKMKAAHKKANDGSGSDSNGNDDDEEDDDDDDEDDESPEQAKRRLVKQRQEEEHRRRQIEAEQQVLLVSVERFAIPEILFRPSDGGFPIDWAGLAESIAQSIQACPITFQAALCQSILLVGGLAQLPNLKPRLEQELRMLTPCHYDLNVALSKDPMTRAWFGAQTFVQREHLSWTQWSISREEWESSITASSSSQGKRASPSGTMGDEPCWYRLLATHDGGGFII